MADGFLGTEEQEAKRVKEYVEHLEKVQEAAYGFPAKCPCGERLVKNEHPLGRVYLTCIAFKNDGVHIRKPWELAIEEEVRKLKGEVDDQFAARVRCGGRHEFLITGMRTELENNAKEIAQLKELVGRLVVRIEEIFGPMP